MTLAFTRIGLTGKPGAQEVQRTLESLSGSLRVRGVEVWVDHAVAGGLDLPSCTSDELADRVELVICVGGDGTLLHAARQYALTGTPLVGVNLGRLGFLVDVSPDQVESRLDELLAGDFIEDERMLLDMLAYEGSRELARKIAFNDVVVHKADASRMLEFSTHVDGSGVTTHRADGMIVATPTGSTAYAMSGGGPILHPSLQALVMVPICPHTLSDRPLVIDAGRTVTITTSGETGDAQVTCDGREPVRLPPGARVDIVRSAHVVRLLHPADYDYFGILRQKLHFG